ncbi:MAG: thymidine phosphorylase [Candidatus Edwardsbacteria bacterium]
MTPYEIIRKKREGKQLSSEEIEFFVKGFIEGNIPDYQISALLMAIFFNGMTFEEIMALTSAMTRSGEVLDLSSIAGIKVDKHSTGGVGDKLSLTVAPLVAAAGVSVPMVSGRGLGHTGGTLDKLESIPGLKTQLSILEFITNLKRIGLSIMGAFEKMALADKKLYSLRDVTATVDSIPLIASSIMSKKMAEGIDALVLDVKTGNGAFMREETQAEKLAQTMIEIGKRMKKKVAALITDMNQPLGKAVGNAVEVKEAIQVLKGEGPEDIKELTLALGAEMLILGKKAKDFKKARRILQKVLDSRQGLKKFRELVEIQNGDGRVVEIPEKVLPEAKVKLKVESRKSGFVQKIDCLEIGLSAVALGAGRENLESKLDPTVGLLIEKKIGDEVRKGEILAVVLANEKHMGEEVVQRILAAYTIGREKVSPPSLIKKIVSSEK